MVFGACTTMGLPCMFAAASRMSAVAGPDAYVLFMA